jgi:hypothetical protein
MCAIESNPSIHPDVSDGLRIEAVKPGQFKAL